MDQPRIHDVAIVGGGPAGLSAALWLARYLYSVVVVDSGDPRNWEARGIHGYLGLHGVPPAELRSRGRSECRAHGVTFVDGEVEHAQRYGEDHFHLILAGQPPVEARRLLLAFGLRDEWPDIPGLDRCYGETAHHCPDCDGFEARDCETVVVSTGKKAVGMVLALATWTRKLTLCTNGADAALDEEQAHRLEQIGVPVITTPIRRLVSDSHDARALEMADGASIPCERLFFSIGKHAADDLGVQIGCRRDSEGLIEIDDHCHTSVMNVFAAGDVTPGPQLAIAAAAQGAVAALAIHRSLLPAELRL
jgi:thioredoxin reductase